MTETSRTCRKAGGRGEVAALPRGAWPIDLDRDGDLGLMLVHGKGQFPSRSGLALLYENAATRFGVTVQLDDTGGAPHGLGAAVVLRTRNGSSHRQVRSVMNHWNATVLPLHFGADDDPGPYRLEVRWPDDREQEVTLPTGRAAYRVIAGHPAAIRLAR